MANVPAAAAADQVIATRGRNTVTIGEARAIIASLDAATRAKLANNPAGLTPILRDMLLRRAILAEAAARHWADKPDIAALLARARDQVLVESFLASVSAPQAGFPTEADIHAAYDQNRKILLLPRQYHLGQIYLPASADARERLVALKQQSAAGLEAAATKAGLSYHDLGWVMESALLPEVKQAVAGLPEGQIADPVCTASGCSLVLLIATKQAGPASFTEAHDTLTRALRQQKQQANERAYEDALLAKAPVLVNELQYPAVFAR